MLRHTLLQWSRGSVTAERRRRRHRPPHALEASMEPRFGDRGTLLSVQLSGSQRKLQWSRGSVTAERKDLRSALPPGAETGFNGAAVR